MLQCSSIRAMGISAIALTAEAVNNDPSIWKEITAGLYSVILASPEILLGHNSYFWKSIVREPGNPFCKRLACIAVDEAHLVWGWREFRKEYQNLNKLRSFFPEVPIMALSATMTRNVMEYIRTALNMRTPVRLYRRRLDRPNITYMVKEIQRPGFEELNFLIPQIGGAGAIPKTMLFMDSIEEGMDMAMHLRKLLPEHLRNKGEEIIRVFSSTLRGTTRDDFLRDLELGNTRIWICTDAAGMGINLRDIVRSIQWKIADHLVLASLLQRIGRAGRDSGLQAISIVFVESKHILPDNISTLEESPFQKSATPLGPNDEDVAVEIISTLYEKNLQTKRESSPSAYYQVDPAVLWFINTTGCRRRLALACFTDDLAFKICARGNCCDNCMYALAEEANIDVPAFECQDVTAQHTIRYKNTKKYKRELVAAKQKELMEQEIIQVQKTSLIQIEACRTALNNFAIRTWFHGMDEIFFPVAWREKLATCAARIHDLDTLRRELHPGCKLDTGSLYAHANELVALIKSAVQAVTPNKTASIQTTQSAPIHGLPAKNIPETQPLPEKIRNLGAQSLQEQVRNPGAQLLQEEVRNLAAQSLQEEARNLEAQSEQEEVRNLGSQFLQKEVRNSGAQFLQEEERNQEAQSFHKEVRNDTESRNSNLLEQGNVMEEPETLAEHHHMQVRGSRTRGRPRGSRTRGAEHANIIVWSLNDPEPSTDTRPMAEEEERARGVRGQGKRGRGIVSTRGSQRREQPGQIDNAVEEAASQQRLEDKATKKIDAATARSELTKRKRASIHKSENQSSQKKQQS